MQGQDKYDISLQSDRGDPSAEIGLYEIVLVRVGVALI